MDTSHFDYELPKNAIAQHPLEFRENSRLLVDGEIISHKKTKDLPDLLEEGDVIVLNETRVMSSRMKFRKETGGMVELLALEEHKEDSWEALIRPSRKVPVGSDLFDDDGDPVIRVGEASGDGTRYIYSLQGTMQELFQKYGEVPLPPYIERQLDDEERYQTVFSNRESSVAAPTAGLHFTEETLQRCVQRGVHITKLELSVGLGTFRPISTESIGNHRMHEEKYSVSEDVWELCKQANRVVAVGTTVVRALESVAATGNLSGRTDLFITPGFEFNVVDVLMTNFHLPRSSLLVMIEAFVGPRWKDLYQIALDEGYRFLSLGDAMFIKRSK